jgi:hypothetical protein
VSKGGMGNVVIGLLFTSQNYMEGFLMIYTVVIPSPKKKYRGTSNHKNISLK